MINGRFFLMAPDELGWPASISSELSETGEALRVSLPLSCSSRSACAVRLTIVAGKLKWHRNSSMLSHLLERLTVALLHPRLCDPKQLSPPVPAASLVHDRGPLLEFDSIIGLIHRILAFLAAKVADGDGYPWDLG